MTKRLSYLLLLAVALNSQLQIQAEEPASEFLQELRNQRYYELAEYYLDVQVDKGMLSDEFRAKMDMERAMVILSGARNVGNGAERDKKFAEAQVLLERFSAATEDSDLKIQANNELGNLLYQRAKLVEFEGSKEENVPRKAEFVVQTRELLTKARDIYVSGREQLKTELESIPKVLDPKSEKALIERRDTLYGEYLQLVITTSKLLEEIALTYPSDAPEYKSNFEEAITEYDSIASRFRRKGVGVVALVSQGRCYLAIDDTKQALSYLQEVIDQRETPAFRNIVNLAMPLYMKTLVALEKTEDAISMGVEWDDGIRPNELTNEEWHAFRLELARTYQGKADGIQAEKPNDAEARKAYVDARKLAQVVLKYPGKYKQDARDILASIPNLPGAVEEEETQPQNFAEALAKGKELMESAQAMEFTIKTLPETIANEQDEQNKQALVVQLNEARQNYRKTQDAAVANYELALSFTDAETPIASLQEVYYYLTFINYSRGNYYEAIVLGEYLARKYPGESGALPCAKIALNCYQLLYNEALEDQRQFEVNGLIDIAEYTIQNWGQSEEANDARRRLVPYMIEAGRIDKAKEYTSQIPEEAPERLESELRIGRTLWFQYRRDSREATSLRREAPDSPRIAELEQNLSTLKASAGELLEAAGARLEAGTGLKISNSNVAALLSLSQYYIEVDQPAMAVKHLENENYGLLNLIQKQDPVASKPATVESAFRAALAGYMSMLAGADGAGNIEKAKAVMQQLNSVVGESPDGKKRLVSIYFTLARDLEEQLNAAETAEKKNVLAAGFETFLDEVGTAGTDFSIRYWAASTMQGLGTSFESNGTLTPKATAYFNKSVQLFQSVAEQGKNDIAWVNEDQTTGKAYLAQIRMNMAQVMKKLGQYEEANRELALILLDTPSNVSVQIEAAKTYNELGTQAGDEQQFKYAIAGSRPMEDGNLVWGWRKLGQMTQGKEQFTNEYYESRIGIALARLGLGQLKQGDERKKLIGYAELEILNTYKIHPELGGTEFTARFDSLLRAIQKELGKPEEGLAGASDAPLATVNMEIPGLEPPVAPAKKDEASSSNSLLIASLAGIFAAFGLILYFWVKKL
ncbi:MAG: hypothetical protein CMM06_09915 [Rhodopirellula sp.]|nr:hypothetical protein [Rhodopirellula sp.]|tara:strand:- start:96362 stop:99658 length:3297 start_codon:yes stop_codon:yes gene_type:complete